MNRKCKNKAFTLAEILISLGIIGIVAAMTLPTLFGNFQKRQTVARLQKVYAELKQAVKLASDEYGDPSGWDYTLSNEEFIKTYFAPYIKLAVINTDYKYTDLSNRTIFYTSAEYPNFITMSGTFILFHHSTAGFQNVNHLLVDINGKSLPNRMGKDVFVFSFLDDNLLTYTQYKILMTRRINIISGTSGQCSYTASGGVFGVRSYCSRLIEFDGWKIADDYPW